MPTNLRQRCVAWLIERHPRAYCRWKKIAKHRIGTDRAFLRLHAETVREGEGVQVLEERYNLWALVRAVADRPGALAEVGVYRGGSAKIICAAKGAGPLHLFDTFAGMPPVNPAADGIFHAGQFNHTSIEHVRDYLVRFPNVQFHPGFFPDSAVALAATETRFKFVHLDLDLHASTTSALTWFYPRMERGGIMLTHDYNDLTVPGVKLAFDEFFQDKPETVVPLWFTQALVVKL